MDLPPTVYQDRLKRTRDAMSREGLDALVVYKLKKNTVKYLSDFSLPVQSQGQGNCFLVVPHEGDPALVVQAASFAMKDAMSRTWIRDVRFEPSFAAMLDETVSVLRQKGLETGRIGLVGGEIDSPLESYLRSRLPGADIKDANPLHDAMRMVKCPEEIALLRRIQDIADIKFGVAMEAVRPGKTEFEVIAATEYAGRKLGTEQTFSDLIGWGAEDDVRLVRAPTSRRIEPGDAVLYEAIPFHKGYNVELIGVLAPGEVSAEQEQLSALCFRAHNAGLAAARPGAIMAHVHAAALEVVKQAGYRGFAHSLGHGIGLDNGEKPDIGPDLQGSSVLEPGMTFAYHANVSVPKVAKAVYGGVYLVTESGVEALSKIPPQPIYYV